MTLPLTLTRIVEVVKLVSEKKALETLRDLREDFSKRIRDDYEHRAAPCLTCSTPGACCLDAHFVNVHISKLEAVAISNTIEDLGDDLRETVFKRIDTAIEAYKLSSEGDTYQQRFACPLFEKGIGCLVHETGKPVACTTHACYENAEDLPPDELQARQELIIDNLNARTYGRRNAWLPIPIALKRLQDNGEKQR